MSGDDVSEPEWARTPEMLAVRASIVEVSALAEALRQRLLAEIAEEEAAAAAKARRRPWWRRRASLTNPTQLPAREG